jgi:hypothetical protein
MRSLPLLLIPVLLANVLTFARSEGLAGVLGTLELPSGASLSATWGDLVLAVGLIALFVEVLKATRAGAASVLDHGLSLTLMVAVLLQFLLLPQAGNGVFLFLVLMCLIDVVAGFAVGMAVARRDIGLLRE